MYQKYSQWPGDVINDVMNIYLYKCSHNLMILTHRKFNDICARFLVIMKNVVISFIKEYLRLPCDVIDDVVIMKKLFWHNLERFFHIWGQIEETRKIAISISDILSFWSTIKAPAQILTEIYQFQNLTYFVTWWRHQWCHEWVKHNLHN